MRTRQIIILAVLSPVFVFGALRPAGERQMINLDGTWEIGQGGMGEMPAKFEHTVPVPGLMDMATPVFEDVGLQSDKREAFWYRRTFTIDLKEKPEVALVKVHKAKFGTAVYINGKLAGEDSHCFTPGYFDVKKYLRPAGEENELVIRVGAYHTVLPKNVHYGADYEKKRYFPGIYGSVELILAGDPYIKNVQIAPEIGKDRARIWAERS